MARPTRFLIPGQPQHVIQRGNNRAQVFFCDDDRRFYLDCLREACARYACDVHAYVLMTNHVHLLVSPSDSEGLPRMMQSVGRRYAQQINWRRERTGSLWEGRYRATAIDSDAYFLTCSRYIELNPVRAGIVAEPGEYPWSSYAANVTGKGDTLVSPHPLYLALGRTDGECRQAYRRLFERDIDPAAIDEIREATQKGWPLGDGQFRGEVARISGRRATPLPKGGRRQGSGNQSTLTRLIRSGINRL
jgi:putative transposase